MSSIENQGWDATFKNSTAPRPSVPKILFDLKKKELESPIFVCLLCTKESHSQQAMAAHCRQHVREGMGKGTVEHIKYYPNDTFIFLGNNPKPNPQGPTSTDQQVMAEAPKIMTQLVPRGNYNGILPYTGYFSMTDLAKYPWLQLNGPNQNIINVTNMHLNCATLQQPRDTTFEGLSSMFPSDAILSPKPNGVGPGTTPSVPPEIDLTLRLGPTPRSSTEVSMQGPSFPFRFSDYF